MRHGRDDYSAIQDVGALLEAGVLEFGPNATPDDRALLERPATSIGADEPVFLLRARDQASGATVAFWTERAALQGADPAMTLSIRDSWPIVMADWGRQNGAKPPDLPATADPLPDGVVAVDPLAVAGQTPQPVAPAEPTQPDGGQP